MPKSTIVVGLDGSESGGRAVAFAKAQSKKMETCSIIMVYVIEWSPFSFQTPEENAERHKRREEEIKLAHERVLDPAVAKAKKDGCDVTGIVRHGDAAEILEQIAVEKKATQIVIGRVGSRGLKERLFGGVSGRLIAAATVPVTIIP